MRTIVIGVVFVATCLTGCQPKQVVLDMASCAKVRVGMSRQDIVEIMGRSVREHLSPDKLEMVLFYSEPRMASGPITIHLAKSGDRYLVDYAQCKGQE